MEVKSVKVNEMPLFCFHSTADVGALATKIIGASYDHKTKTWFFPAYYPFGLQVYDEIRMVFPNATWDQSSVKRLNYLNQCKDCIGKKKDLKLDFKTEPMNHQREALLYTALYMRLGIFWECGVGKTKLAVDTIRYFKQNTLFLCPSRLVENTMEEIYTHSFHGEIEVFPVIGKLSSAKKLGVIDDAIRSQATVPKVLIIGYETVSQSKPDNPSFYAEKVSQFDYKIMFLDESHKLRTHNSKVSVTCSNLARKAPRRYLMTGTPSLGNPLHLYVQMRILMPWRYPNFFAFKNTFVTTDKQNPMIVRGFKNLHVIRSQVDHFSITKSKEECIDLPPRRIIPIHIHMSPEQDKTYREIMEGIHECVEYNPMAILKLSKAHQVCGGTLVESPIDYELCNQCSQMQLCVLQKISIYSRKCINKDIERATRTIFFKQNPKLDYLKELCTTIVHGEGKKVIVWYRYSNEKQIIKEMLKKSKIDFLDYGELGHDAVSKFQKEERPCVFIAQIQSGSGITLTKAEYTIYYSLTFDLEHYLQSRDRMYRKGQTKKTTEYHLLMTLNGNKERSIDEAISDSLQRKVDINRAMLHQDFRKELITKIDI